MTIQDLNNALERELKNFIKSEGYVDSGKLVNSIKFNSRFINNELDIKFDTMEYIKYLDDGKVIKRFFEITRVIEIIQEFYSTNLEIEL